MCALVAQWLEQRTRSLRSLSGKSRLSHTAFKIGLQAASHCGSFAKLVFRCACRTRQTRGNLSCESKTAIPNQASLVAGRKVERLDGERVKRRYSPDHKPVPIAECGLWIADSGSRLLSSTPHFTIKGGGESRSGPHNPLVTGSTPVKGTKLSSSDKMESRYDCTPHHTGSSLYTLPEN